ncbi:MAG: TetR family transcriptional regulator [Acidimicrobiales bacterium]|nr:TetR family transcriptional regulator [Acidimicrobiales bacterium]
MAKPGRRSGAKRNEPAGEKRDRIIEAAFEALRDEGFAHASARSIAARGGFNSALIFYYFDSVNDLLIEALARSSKTQLQQYEAALGAVDSFPQLVEAVQARLHDDMGSGHVRVLAELVGASSSDEQLQRAVLEQVKPWIDFTERTLTRVLDGNGLGGLVPPAQLSFVVVSLFLGMELLTGIAGDDQLIDGLFSSARQLATLAEAFLPAGGQP